jgi:ATP-binding cassette subfamily B protein
LAWRKISGDRQMSAVERLDNQDALIALPRDIPKPAIAAVSNSPSSVQKDISAVPKDDKSARGERLRPLLAVAPYLARYRIKALAALVALTVASLATLIVPVAVRRMIDFGFTADSVTMINSYFSLMIAVVAVLALASASRLYLVTTLGERIVADLRRDVFSHLTSLSPAFFDSQR